MTDSGISSSGSGEGAYQVESRINPAEVADLRVCQLRLAAGQHVPWHYRSNITDTFFYIKGPLCVKTRDPDDEFILAAGKTVAIPPGRPHYAAGVTFRPASS